MKNDRFAISKDTLGIQVIAIGIPTVVGIPTIVNDAISYIEGRSEDIKNTIESTDCVKEILQDKKFDFMVTPNTIDDIITNISRLVSESINAALN